MKRCKRCGLARPVSTANLLGGATHGRPARAYPSNVCLPCADEILVAATNGLRVVDRWDVGSVRRARLELRRAARA